MLIDRADYDSEIAKRIQDEEQSNPVEDER